MTITVSGKTLIFTESVSRTNITVHILQCVTVMNQDTLQHFPRGSTSTPLSHTRLHLTNGLVWLNGHLCADALRYLNVYRISTVCILVSDGGEIGVRVYLLSTKGLIYVISIELTAFQVVSSRARIAVGLSGILTNSFRQNFGPGVDAVSNTKECQWCHLWIKATVCGADNFITFLCRLSTISGSFKLLEHQRFIQSCTGVANVIPHPQKF